MPRRAAAVLLVLLALCALAELADADKKLLQLNFLHRHGARQPPQTVNGQISWANAQLTDAGALMARQMGLFLRSRYAGFISPNSSTPAFVESRSTQVARTIQSGFGLLRSLFGDQDPMNIPFLMHKPLQVDYFMAFNENWPSHQLMAAEAWAWPHNNSLARTVLNESDTALLASVMGGASCTEDLLFCALVAQDVAQCARSNGGLSPVLGALWPKLEVLQMMMFKHALGFKPDSAQAPAGSLAWTLANEWMHRSNAALVAPQQFEGLPAVLHLSAHDNEVAGLLNTLGVINQSTFDADLWVPKFFDTVIAETYADGTVSFFRARPNEAAGSGFAVHIKPLPVLCAGAGDAAVYASTNCPVADAWRFINTSAPATTLPPQCFVTAADLDHFNCTMLDTRPPPSSGCSSFRNGCRNVACDLIPAGKDDSVLDIADGLTCEAFVHPPSFAPRLPLYLSGVAAALAGGVLIGVLTEALLRRLARSHVDTECRPEADVNTNEARSLYSATPNAGDTAA